MTGHSHAGRTVIAPWSSRMGSSVGMDLSAVLRWVFNRSMIRCFVNVHEAWGKKCRGSTGMLNRVATPRCIWVAARRTLCCRLMSRPCASTSWPSVRQQVSYAKTETQHEFVHLIAIAKVVETLVRALVWDLQLIFAPRTLHVLSIVF